MLKKSSNFTSKRNILKKFYNLRTIPIGGQPYLSFLWHIQISQINLFKIALWNKLWSGSFNSFAYQNQQIIPKNFSLGAHLKISELLVQHQGMSTQARQASRLPPFFSPLLFLRPPFFEIYSVLILNIKSTLFSKNFLVILVLQTKSLLQHFLFIQLKSEKIADYKYFNTHFC